MGRRSRNRSGLAGTPPRERPARPAPAASRERVRERVPAVRRTLARYLGLAVLLALAFLIGTISLVGSLGPFLVLGWTIIGVGLTQRWASAALAGQPMSDEDRFMQTMAGGLLVVTLVLAVTSAVVLSVA